jgi:hypothetical protein
MEVMKHSVLSNNYEFVTDVKRMTVWDRSEMKIITDQFLKKQYIPKDGFFARGKTCFLRNM